MFRKKENDMQKSFVIIHKEEMDNMQFTWLINSFQIANIQNYSKKNNLYLILISEFFMGRFAIMTIFTNKNL